MSASPPTIGILLKPFLTIILQALSIGDVYKRQVARWGLQFLNAAPDAKVLDCGCGGGANINRLLKKCPEGIVKGIDLSLIHI